MSWIPQGLTYIPVELMVNVNHKGAQAESELAPNLGLSGRDGTIT